MPEVVRKRPSVVRPCVDTTFDDGFDLSTHPSTLVRPSFDSNSVLLLYLHLLGPFFVVPVAGSVGDGVGVIVGWVLNWYVRRCPFLADFFLYLTGNGFLQDAEGVVKVTKHERPPSCCCGDP